MQSNSFTRARRSRFHFSHFHKKKSRKKRPKFPEIPELWDICIFDTVYEISARKCQSKGGGSLDSINSFKFWGLLCTTKLGSVGGPGAN